MGCKGLAEDGNIDTIQSGGQMAPGFGLLIYDGRLSRLSKPQPAPTQEIWFSALFCRYSEAMAIPVRRLRKQFSAQGAVFGPADRANAAVEPGDFDGARWRRSERP
jgi:hypothetical protein